MIKIINGRKHKLFKCSKCGAEKYVRTDYINKHSDFCMSCLKTGNCQALKHGDSNKRLYHIYKGLWHRRYKNYNPVICEDWSNYESFKKWAIANGYNDSLTIDRVDNEGDYCPENCQFITLEENARKDKILLTDQQKIDIIRYRRKNNIKQSDISRTLGVSRNTIQRAEKFYKEKFNEEKINTYSVRAKKSKITAQ